MSSWHVVLLRLLIISMLVCVQSVRAEGEDQPVEIRNCIANASHPDDPQKPKNVTGVDDLSGVAQETILSWRNECSDALKLSYNIPNYDNRPIIQFNLGRLQKRLGKHQSAATLFQIAIKGGSVAAKKFTSVLKNHSYPVSQCLEYISHPDDPQAPDDAIGTADLNTIDKETMGILREHCFKAFEVDYSNPVVLFNQGRLSKHFGREDSALGYFRKAAKAGSVLAHNELIEFKNRCIINASIPGDPQNSSDIIGVIDIDVNNLKSLSNDCFIGLEIDPENPVLLFNEFRLQQLKEGFDKESNYGKRVLTDYLEKAIEHGSSPAAAFLADLKDTPEEAAKALALYRKSAGGGFEPAIQILPEMEAYAQSLGVEVENDPLAGEKCDKLAAHPEDKWRAEGVAGVVDGDIDLELALDACITATEVWPDNPRYHFQLGRVFYQIGGRDMEAEAIKSFRAAYKAGRAIYRINSVAEYAAALTYLAILAPDENSYSNLVTAATKGFAPARKLVVRYGELPENLELSNIFSDPDKFINFSKNSKNKSFTSDAEGWCIDIYSKSQNSNRIEFLSKIEKNIIKSFVFSELPIEQASSSFDSGVGDLTDFIVYGYLLNEGFVKQGEYSIFFNDDFMLQDGEPSDLKAIIDEIKTENKYSIITSGLMKGSICDYE